MRLKGRVAIITGSGSGIGRATALAMSKEGASVTVSDLNAEAASRVAEEIRQSGGSALAIIVEVTKDDRVNRMVGKTVGQFGRIDILVNNAAGPGCRKAFIETTPQDWGLEIDPILMGTLFCTRAVIPLMIKQKNGRIISMASSAGKLGVRFRSVYSACKAAVARASPAQWLLSSPATA